MRSFSRQGLLRSSTARSEEGRALQGLESSCWEGTDDVYALKTMQKLEAGPLKGHVKKIVSNHTAHGISWHMSRL